MLAVAGDSNSAAGHLAGSATRDTENIFVFFSVKMPENETEEIEAEAEAPPAAAEEDPDKVKPVVFIGLFITALLALGMIGKS